MNHLLRRDLVSSTRCCGECPCSGEVATIVGNGEEKDLLAGAHVDGFPHMLRLIAHFSWSKSSATAVMRMERSAAMPFTLIAMLCLEVGERMLWVTAGTKNNG